MTSCNTREHVFAVVYVITASLFSITIAYLTVKLINGYLSNTKSNRPPPWIFYTGLVYTFSSIIILIKCILYGISHCNYIYIDKNFSKILFKIIFGNLYVLQFFFLWIVLFIRLYYIFYQTPYELSKLTKRIFPILFTFSLILTILTITKSMYTILIVLGLICGMFITLSIIILYVFKFMQVFIRSNDEKCIVNTTDLKEIIAKNTILAVIAATCSLFVLFISIVNFVSSQFFDTKYAYREQFFEGCLLLNVYITTICLIFQFKFLDSSYVYFCGCIHIGCQYYCKQYVNPIKKNKKPVVSIELNPVHSKFTNNHLNGKNEDDIYIIVPHSEMTDTNCFEDLPSLPHEHKNVKSKMKECMLLQLSIK